ncbi:MAG TPA: nuclear transport factor 2 family protein [Terriglobales bacterium]
MHSNENTPNANLELARAYLRAIENRAGEEELESFFSPDVVVEQFPNRLVPNLVKSSLADVKRESEMGKKSVARQSYTVRNAVAAGEWVAMQVDWEGVLAIPVADLEAGATIRAYFAMFLHFRDGKIVHQSNYDCFEPW